MRWFLTNTVRTRMGGTPCPCSGKTNSEADIAHCSHWPAPRALQLIYSHSCLFIEGEGTALFISEKETKKPACADRNRARSVTKWRLSKLKVTNTMLFTSERQGCVVVRSPQYTRPTIHGSRWSRFCVARISGGVIEKCEGEGSAGCGERKQRARRVVSRVTPMRSDVPFKQRETFLICNFYTCRIQTRLFNFKIKHYRGDVSFELVSFRVAVVT